MNTPKAITRLGLTAIKSGFYEYFIESNFEIPEMYLRQTTYINGEKQPPEIYTDHKFDITGHLHSMSHGVEKTLSERPLIIKLSAEYGYSNVLFTVRWIVDASFAKMEQDGIVWVEYDLPPHFVHTRTTLDTIRRGSCKPVLKQAQVTLVDDKTIECDDEITFWDESIQRIKHTTVAEALADLANGLYYADADETFTEEEKVIKISDYDRAMGALK